MLYEQGLVRSPADLYSLTYEQLFALEGFKEQASRNVLQGIENSKQVPFPNVLFGLGIRYVAVLLAERLAQYFRSIDRIAQASYEELIEVPEIGEAHCPKVSCNIFRMLTTGHWSRPCVRRVCN